MGPAGRRHGGGQARRGRDLGGVPRRPEVDHLVRVPGSRRGHRHPDSGHRRGQDVGPHRPGRLGVAGPGRCLRAGRVGEAEQAVQEGPDGPGEARPAARAGALRVRAPVRGGRRQGEADRAGGAPRARSGGAGDRGAGSGRGAAVGDRRLAERAWYPGADRRAVAAYPHPRLRVAAVPRQADPPRSDLRHHLVAGHRRGGDLPRGEAGHRRPAAGRGAVVASLRSGSRGWPPARCAARRWWGCMAPAGASPGTGARPSI